MPLLPPVSVVATDRARKHRDVMLPGQIYTPSHQDITFCCKLTKCSLELIESQHVLALMTGFLLLRAAVFKTQTTSPEGTPCVSSEQKSEQGAAKKARLPKRNLNSRLSPPRPL